MEEFELEPGEKVTRAVRKHWFVLALQLLTFVLLALLPALFPVALALLSSLPLAAEAPAVAISMSNPFVRALLGLWWLCVWVGGFSVFTNYYLNMWIITTTRIIEIHQHGFFRREVSSLLLNRVQDVTTNVHGLFATLIGYGHLEVQTAGTEERFEMHNIGRPEELRDLIMREVAALHADGSPFTPTKTSTGV